MAGVGTASGGELRRREFWLAQLAHQLPMIASMVLMWTVLRSALGVLVILAGLWIVALARARAARTSVASREFLIDLGAMGLVLLIPLLYAVPAGRAQPVMSGMAGMGSTEFSGFALPAIVCAALVMVGWAAVRLLVRRGRPANDGSPLRSLVSGSCCAVGLVAMLAM